LQETRDGRSRQCAVNENDALANPMAMIGTSWLPGSPNHCQQPRQALALARRRGVRQPRLINLKHLPIKKSRCAPPWFRVEADTLPAIAKCVRNASIPVTPISRKRRQTWMKTNRRTQSTQALGADAVIQPADTGAHLVKLHRFGCCARGVIDRYIGCVRRLMTKSICVVWLCQISGTPLSAIQDAFRGVLL